MERKLHGLKVVTDAVAASVASASLTTVASVKQGTASAMSPQELVEWLDANKFVQALFAGHTQVRA